MYQRWGRRRSLYSQYYFWDLINSHEQKTDVSPYSHGKGLMLELIWYGVCDGGKAVRQIFLNLRYTLKAVRNLEHQQICIESVNLSRRRQVPESSSLCMILAISRYLLKLMSRMVGLCAEPIYEGTSLWQEMISYIWRSSNVNILQ